MPEISISWILDVDTPTLPPAPVAIPSVDNYDDQQISDAVAKLVQGAIRRPYGALGQRQTGTTFDDTMDAAAGVFILTPAAPFYVLLLGARRLNATITSLVASVADLIDCIESTGRRVRPLDSLTSLGNARTALSALENASASRDSSFGDITKTPAFQRYELHTQRFLDDAATSIRKNGKVVQTPQEGRSRIAGLVSTVTTGTLDVQRRAGLLRTGIDDFNAIDLGVLLVQGIISRARQTLDARIDALSPLSPTDRLGLLKDTVLDVLAGKAVVRGFGSFAASGEFVNVSGVGVPFADAGHPATAALLPSDFLDPYPILAGADTLDVTVDGGPTCSVTLPQSFVARVEGTVAETFDIGVGNDHLVVQLTGFTDVSVILTHGAARTVVQVCTEINAAVGLRPLVAEPFFNPLKFTGVVNTQNHVGSALEFVRTTGPWSDVGLATTDAFLVTSGSMAGSFFTVTSVVGNVAAAFLVSGSAANATGVEVSAGPALRFLRIRITDAGASSALASSRAITIPDTTNPAHTTLGFFPGISLRSRRTRADEIAAAINASAAIAVAGVARLEASATFIEVDPLPGRTEPTDPLRVVSSRFRATGDIITGGTSAVFTLSGAASAGVVVGDVLKLRSAAAPGEVGVEGLVAAVSDTSVSAVMGSAITTGTGFDIEIGPPFSAVRDSIVRLSAATPNAGDYRVTDSTQSLVELVLDRPLPVSAATGNLPVSLALSVGALRLDLASKSRLTDSELSVDGSGAGIFYNALPARAVGSTPFVLLAEDPKVLSVGDHLEIYTGRYNSPSDVFSITGFEFGQKLLELDAGVSVAVNELDFSQTTTVPFARLRKVERNNYDVFTAQLDLWFALAANQAGFFTELNRLINPLLSNENPTLATINAAKLQAQSLAVALQQLQGVLGSYSVDPVPRVDTLVTSFLSRGSDRAVDTLLEGRFQDFFGYNSEEASYIGNALERMREALRLDLPVRKTSRKEVADQELKLAAFEEPDFEFDQSDTQDVDEPDIPGQFTVIPGGNF